MKQQDNKTMGPQLKPYTTPQLITYGDLRAITQAVGMMGNNDGGVGNLHKTSI